MTRAISKYVYLFMDEVAGAIYTYMTIIKCPKFSIFLKGMPTVMIYYITVLWVHRASSTYFTYTTSI